jgi:hypothetical protein
LRLGESDYIAAMIGVMLQCIGIGRSSLLAIKPVESLRLDRLPELGLPNLGLFDRLAVH